eukprot:COSAG06_NODE_4411_length_4289_cov_22.661098_1_plen_30_part_10
MPFFFWQEGIEAALEARVAALPEDDPYVDE